MLMGAIVLAGAGCASATVDRTAPTNAAETTAGSADPSGPKEASEAWEASGASPSSTLRSEVDWGERTTEALRLMAELVRTNTSGPSDPSDPGRSSTDAAAQAIVSFLERNSIEAETVPMGALGAGVFAMLPATVSDPEPPLLLGSHLDAYPFDAALWNPTTPPLGGVTSNDALFGRGVLSGKGAAALAATTLAALGQRGEAQDRDIILCLIPDGLPGEQDGTKGLDLMIRRHPAIATASVAITGTGLGIRDWLDDERTVHYVTHGELGFARLSIAAVSSSPTEEDANARLARALEAVAANPPSPRISKAAMRLFNAISDDASFPKNFALRSELLAKIFFLQELADRESTRNLATDNVRIAAIAGGNFASTVPALRARGLLAASLLPGTTPATVTQHIRSVVDDPSIHLTILDGADAYEDARSPTLERVLRTHLPASPGAAREVVSFGFGRGPSINRGLSRIGIRTYGVFPVVVSDEDVRSIEGRNEHISTANIRKALQKMTAIVGDLVRPSPSP